MRYLVTGGAGFVGSALVRRLYADGHQVSVLDDLSRGRMRRLHGVSCYMKAADIRDPEVVTQVMQEMRGCDGVIHLAYLQGTQAFYSEPREVIDVALRGILNVLEGCRVSNCRELLLVSSSEAYETPPVWPTPENVPLVVPDPLNPRYSYGGGKIASEIAAIASQQAGILDRLIIVRPHNIYGPDMGTRHVIPDFCRKMNALDPRGKEPVKFPIQGSGEETRSFCYIDDCTEQFMTVLDNSPAGAEIYHLGTMDERTVADVAHEVAKCYGREIKIEPGELPQGSPTRRLPDIRKILELGYAGPQVGFTEGMRRTCEWYRANPGTDAGGHRW